MTFHLPQVPKLVRSAGICGVALAIVIGLQRLFPEVKFDDVQSAVLALVSAWLVNTVRESTK